MYSNRYIDSLYTFFIRVVSEATHSCIPTHTYKCLHTSHTYRHVNTKTEQGDWPRLPGECAKAPCLRGGANVPRGRAKTFRDAISLGLLCRSQRTVLRLRDTPAYIATNSCYRFCFDFFNQRRLLPSFPFFFLFSDFILLFSFEEIVLYRIFRWQDFFPFFIARVYQGCLVWCCKNLITTIWLSAAPVVIHFSVFYPRSWTEFSAVCSQTFKKLQGAEQPYLLFLRTVPLRPLPEPSSGADCHGSR